jgi:hypothetical protein
MDSCGARMERRRRMVKKDVLVMQLLTESTD